MNLSSENSFYSTYDEEIPLNSSDDEEINIEMSESRNSEHRRSPIRVESSLDESRFLERSGFALPDLTLKESRESYYWRWILFGVPAVYGIFTALLGTIRIMQGYHDGMTRFAFWFAFVFELGIGIFAGYIRYRKRKDPHFESWWTERETNELPRI